MPSEVLESVPERECVAVVGVELERREPVTSVRGDEATTAGCRREDVGDAEAGVGTAEGVGVTMAAVRS